MRVSGLLNCGLQIPSLEAGRSFYKDFGLEVSEQGNALAVRCTGRNQDQLILTEGPRKRLDHVAFAVEPGSLPDWQRHLEGLGVRLLYIGDGLWFEDEEGNLIRLRDTGLAPWRPFPPEAFNVGDSVTRTDAARWLAAAEPPRPRRLGHMLIFVADIVAAEAFYTRALGLRLSDRVPGKATFLNSGPGDHHVFGFVQSTHPGLHHTSFEVANIDQLGMGAQLMAANGHREGWGPGPAQPRLQPLPLHQGPQGQLDRVLHRHRPHHRGLDPARVADPAGCVVPP
jgi:catechol-2,3-dioxygenase